MNTTGTPAESYAQDMASGPELNGTQMWAICCSGGGIRSASYCLGALQGLGWWTGAPWDVRAYAAGHPTYPTDSTLEQLYDSAEFDAYRELGNAAVQLALQKSRLARSQTARPAR